MYKAIKSLIKKAFKKETEPAVIVLRRKDYSDIGSQKPKPIVIDAKEARGR